MRKMLYTIWFLGSLLHVGCTKDNYIDTGISNGRYHGNLMQYMGSNSYDSVGSTCGRRYRTAF